MTQRRTLQLFWAVWMGFVLPVIPSFSQDQSAEKQGKITKVTFANPNVTFRFVEKDRITDWNCTAMGEQGAESPMKAGGWDKDDLKKGDATVHFTVSDDTHITVVAITTPRGELPKPAPKPAPTFTCVICQGFKACPL